MEQLNIKLKPVQLKNLIKKRAVQLTKPALEGAVGEIPVHLQLKPHKMSRVHKALKQGHGLRLTLDDEEIEGSGLRDVLKSIKKGAQVGAREFKKAYKDIKPIAGPVVKEVAKQAVSRGISMAEASMGPNPAIDALRERQDEIVAKLGQLTGAYGMMGGMMPYMAVPHYSTALHPLHPAMVSASTGTDWDGFGREQRPAMGAGYKALGGSGCCSECGHGFQAIG